MLSGVSGVRLARPGLSWRSVQSVSSAVLPVCGSVGGRVFVGSLDQRPLSLSLQVLQRRHRLQDLRLAAAHCRSVLVLLVLRVLQYMYCCLSGITGTTGTPGHSLQVSYLITDRDTGRGSH